ncbi:short-chain dehydrogenase/reductase SDR, partial [mine drainage metagenome]
MRSALITGANRGLGLEFTTQLLDAGWQVTACCRAPRQAQELHALATRHAGRVEVQALAVDDAVALADLPARLGALRHLDLL